MSCRFYIISIVFFLLYSRNIYPQYSDEVNKMLGIAPRQDEQQGATYSGIKNVYDSVTYFNSYFSEVYYREKAKPEPDISFLIYGLTIVTSYPSDDPKSCFKVLGEIDNTKDNEHTYRRLQCKDKSGSFVAVVIGHEFSTKVDIITVIYANTTYYFEVEHSVLPKSLLRLLSNTEYLNYNFNEDISISGEKLDAYNFLEQFGKPDDILRGIKINE